MENELLIKHGFVLKNDKYFKTYGYYIISIEEKENNFKLTLNEYWGDVIIFNDLKINTILKIDDFMELAINEVSEYIDDVYFRDNNYKYHNDYNYETYNKTINFLNQDIRISFSRHLRNDISFNLSFFSFKTDGDILICYETNLILFTVLEELINGNFP